MQQDQQLLLKLAGVDRELADLVKKREGLGVDLRVEDFQAGRERKKIQLQALEHKLGELRQSGRKLDLDLKSTQAEMNRLEEDLYGGKITNTKELANIQTKLTDLKKTHSRLEDTALNNLISLEEYEVKRRELAQLVKKYDAKIRSLQKELGSRVSELGVLETELKDKRKREAARLPQATLEQYEKVARIQPNHVAVALVKGEMCDACRLPIPTGILHKVNSGTLQHCQNCGRILCKE